MGLLVLIIFGGSFGTDTKAVHSLDPARVNPLAGEVSVNERSISEEKPVRDGQVVATGPDGRALVRNDLRIITSLDNNTSVVYRSEADGQTSIALESGRVWSRIERTLEQDETYEVYTPTMVAAVRGTSFGLDRRSTEAILVAEGQVAVSVWDPETKSAVPGTEQTVRAGSKAVAGPAGIQVLPLSDADRDAWFAEHASEDWPHAGSSKLEITGINLDGFAGLNAGKLGLEGQGFLMIEQLVLDGTAIPFRVESDSRIFVAIRELYRVREGSSIIIHYDGGKTVDARNVFTGDLDEIKARFGL